VSVPDALLEPPFLLVKFGVTEEDFYRLADEDLDGEFLDGRIVMYSPASDSHEDLFAFLLTLLRAYLDATGLGIVRGSRYPMRLDARWSPEPDLLVVGKGRLNIVKEQRLEGPADLVIEIVSEHHPELDYGEKRPRYQAHRIPEIWIVDPQKKQLTFDAWSGARYDTRTPSAGRLESAALPGFWLDVAWLWQQPLPSTVACLRQILPGI
jgi:Uma2 family endonuclease